MSYQTQTQQLDDKNLFNSNKSMLVEIHTKQSLEVKGRHTIGRHKSCHFVLNGIEVSNTHLIIECEGDQSYAIDQSTNGSFINNVRMTKYTRVLLGDKDRIVIKPNYTFIFYESYNKNIFNNYYITTKSLGTGAFANVKEAIDLKTNNAVAIKIIEKSIGSHSKQIQQEINILKVLNHRNVIRILDSMETDLCFYIALELIRGGDLCDYLRLNGHLEESAAKFIFYQLLLATKYLHDNHITHRDLKPENILLDTKENGIYCRIVVTDFGLAKSLNMSAMKTMCGTSYYIAPEVIENKATYNTLVDCWSLGVINDLPFYHESERGLFQEIIDCNIQFDEYVWKRNSREVLSLLIVDPKARMDVDEALESEWIQTSIAKLMLLYNSIVKEKNDSGIDE